MESQKNAQVVVELLEKARKTGDAGDALKFSQAACNAANAMCSLASALAMK